ncbi:MAG TPA: NAD(+)/NADH kinase [Spirochaetales bacterium]|nr:NAD(+)/NADH kinase [Spirochaetales bacterium]
MKVHRSVQRILIIANLSKNEVEALVGTITTYLQDRGYSVTVLAFQGKPPQFVMEPFDLAFSLGGDGTVLYAARLLADQGVPILPINLGNFGFITEIAKEEWQEAFERYLDGTLRIGERMMLEVKVFREGKCVHSQTALNDMVISSAGISKIVNLSVCLSQLPIVRYRADGVIVSTPTGSTAYSAAAGGPILHPEMEAMILIPICPFTLSHRPLVIPATEYIAITVDAKQRADLILTSDGQIVVPLQPLDQVTIEAADVRVRLIQTHKRSFYTVLKEKLNWAGGPDA